MEEPVKLLESISIVAAFYPPGAIWIEAEESERDWIWQFDVIGLDRSHRVRTHNHSKEFAQNPAEHRRLPILMEPPDSSEAVFRHWIGLHRFSEDMRFGNGLRRDRVGVKCRVLDYIPKSVLVGTGIFGITSFGNQSLHSSLAF
jgi:hypothetical protein